MNAIKQRILVAEADAAARGLLRRRLEAEGYDVVVAEDGEIALRAIGETRPDLLIVDVSLPKIDGIQVVRQVRSVGVVANIPIVILSAYARDMVDRGLAGVRGADGYFSKPIDYRELQVKLTSLLSRTAGPLPSSSEGLGWSPQAGGTTAFVGANGGAGTTTIATNVGVALARQGIGAVLVETARFHGTMHLLWGLSGSGSIDDLPLAHPHLLSSTTFNSSLRTHPSGLKLLLGSSGDAMPPLADGVLALGSALQAMTSHVVFDLDGATDVFGQIVLRRAERVWVVIQPEPASVDRGTALLELLGRWGVDAQVVSILVNQTNPEMILEPAEIGLRLGRAVGGWIPYAGAAASEAANRGLPLIETERDNPAAAAMLALASSLAGRQFAGTR